MQAADHYGSADNNMDPPLDPTKFDHSDEKHPPKYRTQGAVDKFTEHQKTILKLTA